MFRRALLLTAGLGVVLSACSSAAYSPTPSQRVATQAGDASVARKPALSFSSPGTGLTVLYSFRPAPDGSVPLGGVVIDKSGSIFGPASSGGVSGNGAVFALKRNGIGYSEAIIHSFDATDGASPNAAPFEAGSGDLLVTASAGGGSGQYGTVIELSPQGNGYGETALFAFDSTDGATPNAGLLQSGGALYTTTSGGGANGYGNIVMVDASTLSATDVYDFQNAPDGASPDSALVADASGALYGTTYYGGSGECPQGNHLFYHCGTVFKFVPSPSGGRETVLWTFQGGNDGASPYGGLLVDEHGNLYGTTVFGGDPNCGGEGHPDGCGTVFKLTPQKGGQYVETILHNFKSSPDGRYPYGGLVDKDGMLYGTTEFGGSAAKCAIGCGTLFALSTSGADYAVLHRFKGSDGANPASGLLAKGSALYGTTASGGSTGNGVVFRFVP